MRLALPALALLACTDGPERQDPDRNAVAAYGGYLSQLDLAARQYEMAIVNVSETTCLVMAGSYRENVDTTIERMEMLAPAIDALIAEHGGAAVADIACVTLALRTELATHAAAACQSGAVETDQAEVTRHIAAMRSSTAAGRTRVDEALDGLDGDSASWTWTAPSACP